MLETLYSKYEVLSYFKNGLINKRYSHRDLGYINGQIELLDSLIEKESFDILDELLRKTNYRLLKSIEKGSKNLVDILKNPEQWELAELSGNEKEWTNEESLIFSTERLSLVFSKNVQGARYLTNKWQ